MGALLLGLACITHANSAELYPCPNEVTGARVPAAPVSLPVADRGQNHILGYSFSQILFGNISTQKCVIPARSSGEFLPGALRCF